MFLLTLSHPVEHQKGALQAYTGKTRKSFGARRDFVWSTKFHTGKVVGWRNFLLDLLGQQNRNKTIDLFPFRAKSVSIFYFLPYSSCKLQDVVTFSHLLHVNKFGKTSSSPIFHSPRIAVLLQIQIEVSNFNSLELARTLNFFQLEFLFFLCVVCQDSVHFLLAWLFYKSIFQISWPFC